MSTHNHPGISVVSNNNSLIGIGTVNDTNDIVNRGDTVARYHIKRQLNTWGRSSAVFGIECTSPPCSVDGISRNAVAVQSLQQRLGCRVRDGERRDLGDHIRVIGSGCILVRGITRSRRVARVS